MFNNLKKMYSTLISMLLTLIKVCNLFWQQIHVYIFLKIFLKSQRGGGPFVEKIGMAETPDGRDSGWRDSGWHRLWMEQPPDGRDSGWQRLRMAETPDGKNSKYSVEFLFKTGCPKMSEGQSGRQTPDEDTLETVLSFYSRWLRRGRKIGHETPEKRCWIFIQEQRHEDCGKWAGAAETPGNSVEFLCKKGNQDGRDSWRQRLPATENKESWFFVRERWSEDSGI